MVAQFGSLIVCPRCRRTDRRGLAYGRGWFWWPRKAMEPGWTMVAGQPTRGDWAKVVCVSCKGAGVVRA